MTDQRIRCAIYTRKSTEEGLEQDFNSLDAQREAGEAYIASQKSEGWVCLPTRYDDGGFTGGNLDRPAFQRLMADVEAGLIDCIVVYKVDRFSRSLLDFTRALGRLEERGVNFVSVTQQFNTTTSMGRLTLNILLSFAQFEREIISERTRDKIAAARRKGKWSGGRPILGYDVVPNGGRLVVNDDESGRVREIFELYLRLKSLIPVVRELNGRGWRTKEWTTRKGKTAGGRKYTKDGLYRLLTNVAYLGKVRYKDEVHEGEHAAIVDQGLWQRVQDGLRHNGRTRAAISMELFGRSGRQLMPMLLGGAKGIAALREEARQLGLTVGTKDAKAAAKLTDTMNALWKTLKRAAFTIGSALASAVQLVAERITAVAVTAGQWLRQNKGLVISIAQIAGLVLAGGLALMAFGKILAGLGVAIGLAATAFKLFGAVLALVLSPIGVIVTAVVGLGAYLLYATGAAGKALGWLGGKFATLKDDAMGAYQGIADALAAGDIGLAAKILWLTLKMEWKRGVAALLDVWLSFKHGFLKLVYGTWYGALALGELIWHGMEIGWIETTSFFSQTWSKFVAHFKESWVKMKAAAEYAWTWIKSLFDDSIDMGAAREKIKSEAETALKQVDDEKTRKLKERELKRMQEREGEEKRHQARMLEIGKAHEAKKDAMAAERGSRMAEAEKQLRDARSEWQAALKAAGAKRKAKEGEDAGPGKLEGADQLLARIKDATAGLGDKLKTTVRGTFNVAAISGFGAGGAMERTAVAAEQTAKNTRDIKRAVQNGGQAFAP